MLLLCGCYSLVWLCLQNLLLLYGCRLPCRHVLIQQHKHYCCSKVKQGAINNSGIATLPTQTSAVACSKQGQPGILSHAHIILDGMTKIKLLHHFILQEQSCQVVIMTDKHDEHSGLVFIQASIHASAIACSMLKQGRYAYPLVTLQMTERGSSPFCTVHTQFAACILQYKTKFQIIFYADKS